MNRTGPPNFRTANEPSNSIFDRGAVIQQLGLDEASLNEFLSLFFSDAVSHVEEIASGIDRSDSKVVELHAHSLKGSAATIGANRVRDVALQLEIVGKAEDLSQAGFLLDMLKKELAALYKHVQSG